MFTITVHYSPKNALFIWKIPIICIVVECLHGWRTARFTISMLSRPPKKGYLSVVLKSKNHKRINLVVIIAFLSPARSIFSNQAQEQIWAYWRLSGLISDFCRNQAIDQGVGGANTLQKCLYVMRMYCELAQTHLTYFLKIIGKIKMSTDLAKSSEYTKQLIYLCERR